MTQTKGGRRKLIMADSKYRFFIAVFMLLILSFPRQINAQDGVMMQGFYWDVIPGGVWYDSLSRQAETLGQLGFDAIWFPPVYKGANGGYDVGYTPYDYYDLGRFDSHGGNSTSGIGAYIPTRYGTQQGLLKAVDAYHRNGIKVYADIVLNHRSGGITEDNVNTKYGYLTTENGTGKTWTSFPMTNGSKRIAWTDGDEFFYPNSIVNPDNVSDFGGPQWDYYTLYTNYFAYDNALHDNAYNNLPFGDSLIVWGNWLTETAGFDGYRFDFVKGIHPDYLTRWCNSTNMNGKFYVGELYDGDRGRLKNWLDKMNGTTHIPAVFDFNIHFAYKDLSDNNDGYDIRTWNSSGLCTYNGVNWGSIVTFVENHDFDRNDYTGSTTASDHHPVINHKMIAYAHMLTTPGLATIWWRDFFYYGLRSRIEKLIKIRKAFVCGNIYTLTAFTDGSGQYQAPYWTGNASEDAKHVLVIQRTGTSNDYAGNGVILALNKHSSYTISVWVTSQKWKGQTLYDITGNSASRPAVAADGRVLLTIAPDSYSIYVPVSLSLDAPGESGHYPESSLGYMDGTHPHSYTVNPNYRQNAASTGKAKSGILPGSDADLYAAFNFETSGKKIYLVYTTDGTVPSKINGTTVEAAFSKYSGNTRWFCATIPSAVNNAGTTVKYAFFISNDALSNSFGRIAGTEGVSSQYQTAWTEGDNCFSYKVRFVPAGTGGDWKESASWQGGTVPGTMDEVEILGSQTLTLSQETTINSLLIAEGGGLNLNGQRLIISGNGTIENHGVFTASTGKVEFLGAGNVSGAAEFNDLILHGMTSLSSGTAINGKLQIAQGGSVELAEGVTAPVYGSSSVLVYQTGGSVIPGNEWSMETDHAKPGVPVNVRVENPGTILRLSGNAARLINGNLTIDNGCSVILSDAGGADIVIRGNLVNNGTFNSNYREVVFAGTAPQQYLPGAGAETRIDYLRTNNSEGLTLGGSLTVSGRVFTENGKIFTGSNNITLLSNATLAGEKAGSYVVGTVIASRPVGLSSSDMCGIGAAFAAGTNDLGSVTVVRQSGPGSAAAYGGKNGIDRTWNITSANPPSDGREITLSWNSDDDNGNSLTSAQVWKSSDGGLNWVTVGNNADMSSHSATVTVNSLSVFTVSSSDSPLPVELSSFTSELKGSVVKLKWITQTEVNSYGFEVQRRKSYGDGTGQDSENSEWHTVKFVGSTGNSNKMSSYSLTDTLTACGEYSYRLKMIDNDGSYTYSSNVGISVKVPLVFALRQNYPNPFNPSTLISFDIPEDAVVVLEVFNTLGEKVATLLNEKYSPGSYTVNWNAGNFASGMYIYRLTTSSSSGQYVKARKMVLIR